MVVLSSSEWQGRIEQLFGTIDREERAWQLLDRPNGETTLTDYGAYAIKDGKLMFGETIKAAS